MHDQGRSREVGPIRSGTLEARVITRIYKKLAPVAFYLNQQPLIKVSKR